MARQRDKLKSIAERVLRAHIEELRMVDITNYAPGVRGDELVDVMDLIDKVRPEFHWSK